MPDAPGPQGRATVSETSSTKHGEPCIKVEHEAHQPETPITYVPRHLRQEMAAAAQQAQAQTPPHRAPTHTPIHASTSGSGMNNAPGNRDPVDATKPSGLTTPIQTPVQAPRPPPPRAPPPRTVATSSLARMRSVPERSVSFAESMPTRAGSADTADQDMDDTVQINGEGNDEDEDVFRLSTQDDAFLATVDLGEGDLGRPIDFEEGMSGVSVMDTSVLEPGRDVAEQLPAVALPQPQPQPQVRDRAGSYSGGPPKTTARNEAQGQPVANPPLSTLGNGNNNADPNPSSSSGQPWPQPQSGPPNTASTSTSAPTSSTRTGPPAQEAKRPRPAMISMGGFHFPLGMVGFFLYFFRRAWSRLAHCNTLPICAILFPSFILLCYFILFNDF